MAFLKTILIILIVWYLIKFVARLLMPFLLKKMVQKVQKDFTQPPPSNTPKSDPKPPKKDKKVVGEYIDFEEIKD